MGKCESPHTGDEKIDGYNFLQVIVYICACLLVKKWPSQKFLLRK